MKKKMIIFGIVIVVLFAGLYFVIDYKNDQAMENNPYGKDDLHQATIDQLDSPYYGNQILPEELNKKVKSGEKLFVYFYSPTCPHCKKTTPMLAPLAKDMNVDMKKLNLIEFPAMASMYMVRSTPTLVYFNNGKEVDRVNGAQSKELFTAFFNKYKGSSDQKASQE
ncbi:thioredoxin family protein [Virgibacillus ihumii]|uniref:thioredoxin family protein n=1 Tax=Virgibacillus ihumii TaxID=2686091 RepID=UPI00157DFA8E|nr:thioredoxin family protein [Virgibacillus ihumii]